MSEEGNRINRRSALKNFGAAAATLGTGTGLVTARESDSNPDSENVDILDIPEVRQMWQEVGEPDIQQVVRTTVGDDKLTITELETRIGTLKYSDTTDIESGDDIVLMFLFDDLSSLPPRNIPSRLQGVPQDSDVALHLKEGDIKISRTLSDLEKFRFLRLINSKTGYNFGWFADISGVYSQLTDGIQIHVEGRNEEDSFVVRSDQFGTITQTVSPSYQGTEVLVESETVTPQDHCNSIIFHPCSQCAAGAAGTGLCAPTCAGSFGTTCAVCLVTGGYTVNTCCKCLHCIDGFDWEDNPELKRKCPEDVVP